MATLLPSTATRNITILEPEISTTLTISAPTSRSSDLGFNIAGILIRNDTGVPVPNASIELSYNGVSLGSVITGVDGDYIKFTRITTPGTYTLTASFTGGSGFAASMANQGINIGLVSPLTAIALPLIFAIATFFYVKK